MAIDTTINAGAPPLLWSDVQAAFDKVNQNFIDVQATIAGASITPVDFTNLRTNVSPAVDNNFNLGSSTNKWAAIFSSSYSTVPGNEFNGVWLGNAHIQGLPATDIFPARINLPAGSSVDGNLIIDPNKTAFREIQVNNNSSIVATEFADSFNIISGDGIDLIVDSSSDSIEIVNSGIIDIVNDDGISVVNTNGVVTITNTGVRTLTSTTSIPTGRVPGTGINIDNASGDDIKITNAGVISVTAGSGIGIIWNPATGDATIRNDAAAVNSFSTIQVNNDTDNRLIADAIGDTLNINSGQGISLVPTNTGLGNNTDTLTISINPVFDLKGSVFGDDSTMIVDAIENKVYAEFFGNLTGDVKGSIFGDDSTKIVDAVENKVYGGIFATTLRTSESEVRLGVMYDFADPVGGAATYTVALGAFAGEIRQNSNAIAIGYIAANEDQGSHAIAVGTNSGGQRQAEYAAAFGVEAGYRDQGIRALALGYQAGAYNQGEEAVAIGYGAGVNDQAANSIIINASGNALNGSAAGLFVAPVRNQTGASGVVQYDATTKEISYSSSVSGTFTGNIFTTLIDSADSSAITVTPAIIFNADVSIGNDVQLSNIESSIRGTDKIKFVPSNADELAYNVRLDVYSESTIEPRLALDTPDGVDMSISSGLAGILISKINGRVNLAAGNNAFIVRENGSWAMTASDAAPGSPTIGVYIANGTTWDPASKGGSRPYPVFYDGASFNALY